MKNRRTSAGWTALIGVAFFVIFLIITLAIDDPGPFAAGLILSFTLLLIAFFVFLADYLRNRRWEDVKYSNRTTLIVAAGFFLVMLLLRRMFQTDAFLELGCIVLLVTISIVVVRALVNMRRSKNPPNEPQQTYAPPRSRVSTSDDIRAGMARAKAYQAQQAQGTQKKPAAPQSVRRTYQFRVAGIIYRKDALFSVATLNPDYYAMEDDGPDGWRIYKYTKELPPVALVPEPENKYDPNAIGVYMKGHFIGYVPRDETAKIREIRAQGSYSATAQLTGGPWLSWRDGEKITGEHGMDVIVTVSY